MEKDLISIIVPIYKVEEYLENCVKSIQNQTYKNLEIILVNDGSPDNCGKICDELAVQDSRIKVIHKENGGLSSARNAGLAIAKGEYFGFVDSDDCIHPQMYELLYNDIASFGTKLAFCQPNMCYNEEIPEVSLSKGSVIFSKKDLIHKCLKEVIWFCAWSKLYHCSLKEYVQFPIGRTNEDYAIMLMVYDKCDNIAVNYNKLYNYCKREGSISTAPKLKNLYDAVVNAHIVSVYIEKNYTKSACYAFKILIGNISAFINRYLQEKPQAFSEYYCKEIIFLRKNRSRILTTGVIPIGMRYLMLSASFGEKTFFICKRIYSSLISLKK